MKSATHGAVILALTLLASTIAVGVRAAEPDAAESGAAEPGSPNRELALVIGETRTISALGVTNYSEGDRGIVEVKLTTDRTQFVIVAKRAGTTSLLLIHRDGKQTSWLISVFQRSPEAVRHEVGQLLQSSPALQVRRVGARFFIEGSATDPNEVARAERIAALFPGQVESLVVPGAPPVERKLNIRIDFFFVQYDRMSGYAFGVDWPQRIGGEVIHSEVSYDYLRGTTTTATASVIDQPLPALDIASHSGWAKVLKQSTVITANGSQATFESGGEQNFTVSAAQTASIQQIEYGTKVGILPRLDAATGDLEIEVQADVAHLVPPAPGTGLPGRAKSRLETTVRMKLGQSLILSGIRASTQRVGVSGVPMLSDIPVLGLLFGSRRADEEQMESALFVIPSAVESVPRPAQDLVDSALRQFQRYSGDLREVSAYPKQLPQWRRPR